MDKYEKVCNEMKKHISLQMKRDERPKSNFSPMLLDAFFEGKKEIHVKKRNGPPEGEESGIQIDNSDRLFVIKSSKDILINIWICGEEWWLPEKKRTVWQQYRDERGGVDFFIKGGGRKYFTKGYGYLSNQMARSGKSLKLMRMYIEVVKIYNCSECYLEYFAKL